MGDLNQVVMGVNGRFFFFFFFNLGKNGWKSFLEVIIFSM